MNYELLQKHINATFNPKICAILEKDGSNVKDFFCADVVGNRRFAQNYGGYPRSEIAEINAAATLQEQMNLLSAINDYTPSSNPNAGLSDAEIMLSHKSKYLQSATEMQSWIENQIEIRNAKVSASNAQSSSEDGNSIKFDSSDSDVNTD